MVMEKTNVKTGSIGKENKGLEITLEHP